MFRAIYQGVVFVLLKSLGEFPQVSK